mgnify:CR=1 FL=1
MAASPAWLTLSEFKLRSVMPPEDVDRLDDQYPGFLAQTIASEQARIESRLRKRYAIPFALPFPETAIGWLVAAVTLAAYQRRGWNPSSEENQLIVKADETARAELKEAADSNEGLYDLPLRENAVEGSGIAKGGPYGYSEASPYVWTDCQRTTAWDEDGRR